MSSRLAIALKLLKGEELSWIQSSVHVFMTVTMTRPGACCGADSARRHHVVVHEHAPDTGLECSISQQGVSIV